MAILFLSSRRINRNIVECKCKCCNHSRGQDDELIETLWNVNSVSYSLDDTGANELIETLWNVNTIITNLAGIINGINRNIVECKCITLTVIIRGIKRINRNIVECKLQVAGLQVFRDQPN